jgi:hypothetical protein
MGWLAATALGACGGAIVAVISVWGDLLAWQKDRRDTLVKDPTSLPGLSKYIDPPADALVTLTRLLLGAMAGLVFRTEVTGSMAAVAVGASAPALLSQLGSARNARTIGPHGDETAETVPIVTSLQFPAVQETRE